MMHNNNSQSQYESEEKESSGKCCTCIGFLVCIFMSVIIMIYGAIVYGQVSEFDHSVEGLVVNWKSSPIVDIQTSDDACPTGYESLIRGGWAGTVEGCRCAAAWNPLLSNFTRDTCSALDTKNGCTKVLPQKPIACSKFYSKNI